MSLRKRGSGDRKGRRADDSLLKKQLDQKWRTLDQFEASLRKLEAHKLQWKAKYAIKEGELEAAKVCPLFLLIPVSLSLLSGLPIYNPSPD
jgi:hypothetical protein